MERERALHFRFPIIAGAVTATAVRRLPEHGGAPAGRRIVPKIEPRLTVTFPEGYPYGLNTATVDAARRGATNGL